jgi:hypothetical protein
MKQILQKGNVQQTQVCLPPQHLLTSTQNSERQGDTNDSKGAMLSH